MDDVLQHWEISVVQTESASQLPKSLDGIKVWAVWWKKIQSKTIPMLLSPFLMKSGVVVAGVVRNDQNTPAAFGTDLPETLQERVEGHPIESLFLTVKDEFAVPQTDSSKVADTAPRGMMKQDRIAFFRRHPHATSRSVLLEVDLVRRPEVDLGISCPVCQFFYMPAEPSGQPEQSVGEVCAAGNRIP